MSHTLAWCVLLALAVSVGLLAWLASTCNCRTTAQKALYVGACATTTGAFAWILVRILTPFSIV